jgi:hypothetical protein
MAEKTLTLIELLQGMAIVALILYILQGTKTSLEIAEYIDTPVGKALIALIVMFLFAYTTPFLGIIALIAAYHLVKESKILTGSHALENYYPTEASKWTPFSPLHQFPYTLEQEMVKKMAPQKFNTNYKKAPYKPVLEDNHDAAYVYDDVRIK